jgi:serine/threonine-protein kinase
MMAQLCDVMVYVHAMLLVHHNIKPENVLCEAADDGTVRVVLKDFGSAQSISDTGVGSSFSRCGSPGYMAPELFQDPWPPQAMAESALNVTKLDVFSFGLLLSTMLTGRNPYAADTHSEMYRNNAQLKYDPWIHFSEVNIISMALRSLLCSVCAPDPLKRFTAAEAAAHTWFQGDRIRVSRAELESMRETDPNAGY